MRSTVLCAFNVSLPVRLLTGNLLSADDNPSKTIAAVNAVSVDSPQRHVASWLTQHNAEIPVTARAGTS